MTSAGGSKIVMVLLCIYCLQLRKPTQVPVGSIFTFSIMTVQAAIRKELNEFKSTEMEVHEESRQFTRHTYVPQSQIGMQMPTCTQRENEIISYLTLISRITHHSMLLWVQKNDA
ncbi:hypothetical protein Q9233_012228 [Columba guinea]|nr:hypothetical protein Q9233_012228 [Columba guinea]